MKASNFSKQDILQAYDELGGIDYLYKNPALMERILLKILKAPVQQPNIIIDLVAEMPWIDWANRLSFEGGHREGRTLELVQEAQSSAQPVAPPALPWREPAPDGLAKTMRDFDKKD